MDHISAIMQMRSTPGVLIFNLKYRLLYSNAAALDILPVLGGEEEGKEKERIQEEIKALCRELRENSARKHDLTASRALELDAAQQCCLRAFFLGGPGNASPSHILVLIERVAQKRRVNYRKAGAEFKLSKREIEVLRLICEGYTNKKISETLYISEYTAKDHVKNIMKKMQVASRNEIMAALG